jgi:hypothetical protein
MNPLNDKTQAKQDVSILQSKGLHDSIKRFPVWNIHRFESTKDHKMAKREETRIFEEVMESGALVSPEVRIPFYEQEEALELFGEPEFSTIEGNLLLNEGINEMWTLIAGTGATQFATGTYMGVGDSSTAEAATQTDLQAATNKLYIDMDDGYPTYGTNQYATWRSTFASDEANYAWNEYTLSNTSDGTGVNLCRKVSSQGTKQSGQVWELTYQITLS